MKKILSITLIVCLLVAFFAYPTLAAEQTSSYTLQYSTLVSWDPPAIGKYNCYAYVLGITKGYPYPGSFYEEYWGCKSDCDHNNIDQECTCENGCECVKDYDDATISVMGLAEYVQRDLYILGYECVVLLDRMPENINYGQTLIAIRKSTQPSYDFHFAVLKSDGWYHKPSITAILKFNEAPSNDVPWTNERYDNNGYHEPNTIYDSEIVYILFSETHGYVEGYTGNNYHSGSSHYYEMHYGNCRNCGEEHDETKWISTSCFGPPCLLPFSDPDTPVEY